MSCLTSFEILGNEIIFSISIGRVEVVGESEPNNILLWPIVLIRLYIPREGEQLVSKYKFS